MTLGDWVPRTKVSRILPAHTLIAYKNVRVWKCRTGVYLRGLLENLVYRRPALYEVDGRGRFYIYVLFNIGISSYIHITDLG